jgi:hypothetical protein
MRRAILSSGVLFLIATADASGQSATKQFTNCSVGSSCDRTYFDAVLASTGAIAFDFFLLTFDGSRRAAAKRSLVSNVPGSRTSRAAEPAPAPSDWRTEMSADDRSIRLPASEARRANSSADLELSNRLERPWWDWLERVRESQRSESADDTRKSDNAGEQKEKRGDSEAAPRNRGDDGKQENGDAKPDRGDHHESPKKPDHRPDVLDGALTPEPSTLLLIASGLPLALAFVRRRRR